MGILGNIEPHYHRMLPTSATAWAEMEKGTIFPVPMAGPSLPKPSRSYRHPGSEAGESLARQIFRLTYTTCPERPSGLPLMGWSSWTSVLALF